ncbi:HlyU family transcriptional regulator [Rhodanobacter aciditrophus]|uniref:HlyU family transcriptional regulator n=1 Tax=Rhodanobacter aciditrophus TaxID=1623218 RepID=A0ABW4AY29_9GAMM
MGIFSSLSKIFSGSPSSASTPAADPIEYNGFTILPTPQSDQGQYRVCAQITKGAGEDVKTHHFIRSDLVANKDECVELTIRKAKLTIDQMGDQIF